MKTIFRITVAVLLFCMYTSCQKEVSNTFATTTGQDSTGTGTDSTLIENNDSLTILSFTPDSGAIGTEVRITGTGFSTIRDSNHVRINNTPATVTGSSKTGVTVQVLQGSTSGKIIVSVNGKTAISLRDFIVLKDSVVSGTNQWKRKGDFPEVW